MNGRIILPQINPLVTQSEISEFITQKIAPNGLEGGVIGLSGGVDSSTVAFLTAYAFDQHYRKTRNRLKLVCIQLPSNTNWPGDKEYAREVIEILQSKYPGCLVEDFVVHIGGLIDAFRKEIPESLDEPYHIGNLSAEIRAVILSRFAAKKKCIILGTGNLDEDYNLGYFTKRGDGAVDISPIGGLSKRLVRVLAAHMGVPQRIIGRAPTAGLWHGQTDEGELGFKYEEAEKVLIGHGLGMSAKEIQAETGIQLGKIGKILSMHGKNKHKMCMPPVASVSFLK